MGNFFSRLLDLLFPPKCIFCRKLLAKGEQHHCAHCLQTLPWLRGSAVEQTGEFFSLAVSPLLYEDEVRTSFLRYKFKDCRGYSEGYGALMAQCVRDHLKDRYDLITWVPLSERRKKQRGYDQAMLLALSAALSLEDVAVETLRKIRHTDAQSGLSEDAARRANILGAYEVTDRELVAGKRILLIDDVITTGSTISECARILRSAGATDVVCATLARARR
jgi:competence protein ComFC